MRYGEHTADGSEQREAPDKPAPGQSRKE